MIGKGKSIAHTAKAIDYALNKEHAQVLEKYGVSGFNGKELEKDFSVCASTNEKLQNRSMSFVLSPEPSNGKALNDVQYRDITQDFLKEMGLDKHQYVVIKHQDRAHTHLHVYVNRCDFSGKTYKDSFLGKRSQLSADKVAESHQLTRAMQVKEQNKTLHKALRNEIHKIHESVLKQRPKDFKQYSDLMQSKGVKVIPSINKAGKLQGYRVLKNGLDFKASAVHRSMSLGKMGVKVMELSKGVANPPLAIASKILEYGVKAITKGIDISR